MNETVGEIIRIIWPLIIVGVLLLLGGGALVFFTIKRKVEGKLRKFQLLAGASALGIPVFAVLHNVAYMLGIMWFGESAFGNGDEPVFFIIATMVCPLGLLVGGIGTLVLRRQRSRR